MINANPIMVVYAENEQDALLCLAKLIVYVIMCISGRKCYLGEMISKKFDTVDMILTWTLVERKVGHTPRNIILSCVHSSDEIFW
mgnify:CR=1 FL=1